MSLASVCAFAQAALPDGQATLLDGFEDGNYWQAVGDTWDKWGQHNLSLEANTYDQWATEGTTSGEWVFDKIPLKGSPEWKAAKIADTGTPQATFFCDNLAIKDWTGVKYIVLDINNPNKDVIRLEFCSQTTDNWNWTQTKPKDVQPGVSTVVFDLSKDLDGVAAIPGMDQMKRAMFTVVGIGEDGIDGKFYVDNIRIIQ
jgi:hypothetical protein